MAKIINSYYLDWRDFDYIQQDIIPPAGTAEYEEIKEEVKKWIKEGIVKSLDCPSKITEMIDDYNINIHLKSFSVMLDRLTKKIEKMVEIQNQNQNMLWITTPSINTAILVNKIASKYGSEFKIIALKKDVKYDEFKFPVEYVRGDHRFISLIGCEYHDLFNKINEIEFFNTSIEYEIDPAEQLRAGLIKRGF